MQYSMLNVKMHYKREILKSNTQKYSILDVLVHCREILKSKSFMRELVMVSGEEDDRYKRG